MAAARLIVAFLMLSVGAILAYDGVQASQSPPPQCQTNCVGTFNVKAPFFVYDSSVAGSPPVSGATVNINTGSALYTGTTNTAGVTTLTLLFNSSAGGTFPYTVSRTGYNTYGALMNVPANFDNGSSLLQINVGMIQVPAGSGGGVLFTVHDRSGQPVAGIDITMAGETRYSDNNGHASFIVSAGTYEWSTTDLYCSPKSGSVQVLTGTTTQVGVLYTSSALSVTGRRLSFNPALQPIQDTLSPMGEVAAGVVLSILGLAFLFGKKKQQGMMYVLRR